MTPPKKGTKPTKHFSILDESKKLFKSKFYDSYFMTEFGKIETSRSERYGATYSIIVLHVEKFKDGKLPQNRDEILDFVKKLVTTVLDVVRTCDVVGMIEDKRLIIILPQTDYFGSLITIRKLTKALEFITTAGKPYGSIIFSQATFPKDANGYGELVGVALNRIAEKKESLWEKHNLKGKLFWEILEAVPNIDEDSPDYSSFDMETDEETEQTMLDRINEMILQDIKRCPQKKGILYMGVKKVTPELPIKKLLASMGATTTKTFLIGAGETEETTHRNNNTTTISLKDRRIAETLFTFFLNEDVSYAVVCREAWSGTLNCFHTSDPYLVEGLVMKFQRDYLLQEQL